MNLSINKIISRYLHKSRFLAVSVIFIICACFMAAGCNKEEEQPLETQETREETVEVTEATEETEEETEEDTEPETEEITNLEIFKEYLSGQEIFPYKTYEGEVTVYRDYANISKQITDKFGIISAQLADFDDDGEEEMLVIRVAELGNDNFWQEYGLYANILKVDENKEIQISNEYLLADNMMFSNMQDVDVFIKDNIIYCQMCFQAIYFADGSGGSIRAITYSDGEIVEIENDYVAASDVDGEGAVSIKSVYEKIGLGEIEVSWDRPMSREYPIQRATEVVNGLQVILNVSGNYMNTYPDYTSVHADFEAGAMKPITIYYNDYSQIGELLNEEKDLSESNEESQKLNTVQLGSTKEYVASLLGTAVAELEDNGLSNQFYLLDETVVRCVFADNSLVGYFITAKEPDNNIELDMKFFYDRNLGKSSFHEIMDNEYMSEGGTNKIMANVPQGTTAYLYYWEFYHGSGAAGYQSGIAAYLPYGFLTKELMSLTQAGMFYENTGDQSYYDEMMQARKSLCPNTFGIIQDQYAEIIQPFINGASWNDAVTLLTEDRLDKYNREY